MGVYLTESPADRTRRDTELRFALNSGGRHGTPAFCRQLSDNDRLHDGESGAV